MSVLDNSAFGHRQVALTFEYCSHVAKWTTNAARNELLTLALLDCRKNVEK